MMYLIDTQYRYRGSVHPFSMATGVYRTKPDEEPANRAYLECVTAMGEFERRMTEVLYGKSTVSVGGIELFLPPRLEHLILEAEFNGFPIHIYRGEKHYPRNQFELMISGVAERLEPVGAKQARLVFKDPSSRFEHNLTHTQLADGSYLPRMAGTCFNITPKLVDKVNRIWAVNDGSIEAIHSVKEGGYPIAFTADLAQGRFSLNGNPQGTITVDATAPNKTAKEQFNWLLGIEGHSAAQIEEALPDYELGLYLPEPRSLQSIFDEIAQSVRGFWFYDRYGQLNVKHFNITTSETGVLKEGAFIEHSLDVKNRVSAIRQIKVGYARNYTPQTEFTGAVEPDTVERLRKPYLYEPKSQAGQREMTLDTLIVNKADAVKEAEAWLKLFDREQTIFSIDCIQHGLQQGDEKTIHYPRYFAGGKAARVTGVIDNLDDQLTTLELLA